MQSFTEVWEKTLEVIRPRVTAVSYESWIKLLKPVKMEKNTAYFYVRTLFQKGTIQNNFSQIIADALFEVMGFNVEVEIITESEAPPRIIEKAKENEEHFNEVLNQNEEYIIGPQQKLTFDNFVVGNENKFAHAAAYAVANNPGNAYNPLFIYGRSGLGKTHLMYAIANQIKSSNPEAKILYIKSEEFVTDMVETLQKGK
ncbi:MAG: chromosomal replication initiator protein DnaA, partial [Clostridia bacterium]|nr:chromosomal replication initiator protein DnaA [Clostridia bacterium]